MRKKIVFICLMGFVLVLLGYFYQEYGKIKNKNQTHEQIMNYNIQESIKEEIKKQAIQDQKEKMNKLINHLNNPENLFSDENHCTVQRASYLGKNGFKFSDSKILKIDKKYYPENLAIFLQEYCIGLFSDTIGFEYKNKKYERYVVYKNHIPFVYLGDGEDVKLVEKIKELDL